MSIVKPYTFTAGTKARANEVNADFDTLYSQVNTNISAIAENTSNIEDLDTNKADVNGNSSERFAVANPTANTDAVNKQTLMNKIGNSIDLISGLTITKDSNNPNNTIIVSAGSAYDSTKTVVLSLANSTSKTNSGQGASTTYYVHIIGDATGSSTNILISSNSTSPSLPSGYTLYRCIGNFTTDSSSKIDIITSYGLKLNSTQSISVVDIMPNYGSEISISLNISGTSASGNYTVTSPGYINILFQSSGNDPVHDVKIDNKRVYYFSRGGDYGNNKWQSGFIAIDKGSKVSWSLTQITSSSKIYFVPCNKS